MKTRLIIIGIVAIFVVSVIVVYGISTEHYTICDSKDESDNGQCILNPEQYCTDWCDVLELYVLGCDPPILDFINRASNLFDETFDDVYYLNWIGLPDDISEEKFEWCLDFIHEKRTSLKLENEESINKFTVPTIYIFTEDGDDKLSPHYALIDLDSTNSVMFVNNSTDPVRIQEIGENKIVNIPQDAWRTKPIAPGAEITMQFNSTGHYEFNVKKITDFLPGYFEHHATGEIVVLSNDTNSLPVEIRAKMAQSIVGGDFRKGVGLISVGSGSAEPGITIGIHEKFEKDGAENFYYEKYRKIIPFDVPIRIEFTAPFMLGTG